MKHENRKENDLLYRVSSIADCDAVVYILQFDIC
nr:MAG TPA: hypothetical protein [Caudoviricetes sp.]